MSLRCLNQIFIELSETSQKRCLFLWRLYDISNTPQKTCLFCDVFKASQIHLKKDGFQVTSLKRVKHISKKIFAAIQQKRLWADKIDVEPLKTVVFQ